jgi:putative NADH-flavin reductase
MNIILFGGHGRTGKCVLSHVGQHTVSIFDGDVMDEPAVDTAIHNVEAVISVIGHVKGSKSDMQTIGIRNIISAMQKHRVKRIVCLTGTGVRQSGDHITAIDRFMNLGISIVDPARVRDGIDHVLELQKTDLNYTVIRVLKLTNGKSSSDWQLTKSGPTKPFTSRDDVATAIVQVIDNESFIRQMPMLTLK